MKESAYNYISCRHKKTLISRFADNAGFTDKRLIHKGPVIKPMSIQFFLEDSHSFSFLCFKKRCCQLMGGECAVIKEATVYFL